MYPRDPNEETTFQRMIPGILLLSLWGLFIFWLGSFEPREAYSGRVRFIIMQKGTTHVTFANWDRVLIPYAEDSAGVTFYQYLDRGDSLSLKAPEVRVFKVHESRTFTIGR
jgi:hypothetical protein